jgi:hypothetical protein
MEMPHLALFFDCLVLNPRLLLSSLDGWYTVHVFKFLKAFVLDEQMLGRSVVLYVLEKFKAK